MAEAAVGGLPGRPSVKHSMVGGAVNTSGVAIKRGAQNTSQGCFHAMGQGQRQMLGRQPVRMSGQIARIWKPSGDVGTHEESQEAATDA